MSIFPFFTEVQEDMSDEEELPVFREYAYDYEKNCLKTDLDGNSIIVEENEALKIWIYKALMTARYRYVTYTDDYGSELDDLTGVGLSYDVITSEIQRMITEALIYSPYITAIKDFNFDKLSSGIKAKFTVSSIYDDLEIEQIMKGAG